MNNEQKLKRLAMNIVNQLFDLADVPVEGRQAINDEADAFVLRLLQQCNVIGALPTDKEILKQAKKYDVEDVNNAINRIGGFIVGAKWMRDLISGNDR